MKRVCHSGHRAHRSFLPRISSRYLNRLRSKPCFHVMDVIDRLTVRALHVSRSKKLEIITYCVIDKTIKRWSKCIIFRKPLTFFILIRSLRFFFFISLDRQDLLKRKKLVNLESFIRVTCRFFSGLISCKL